MDIRLRLSIDLSPPFTAAQAHAEGLSDHDIRMLVQQGRIVRRRRGIYVGATFAKAADAHPETSHALDVAALRLALKGRRNLVAVGSSAARIHGLESYKPWPRRIEVVSADPTVHPVTRDGYGLTHAVLPDADLVEMHDVLLTDAGRTAVDVAVGRDFVDRTVLLDSGLHKQLFVPSEIGARIDALDSVFVPDLRDALAFANPLAESALESAARAIFHLLKLPPPMLQVWLLPGIRVDFFWPEFRTVGEADGLIKYLRERPADVRQTVADERERQLAVEAAGYAMFRFDWDDLADRVALAAGLRAAFAVGAALS
jgi:hypothetical protein